MEELGFIYFDDGDREEIARFRRYSYFPNRVFFSTKTENYCLTDNGFFKCNEVFKVTDQVIEIEFIPVPIAYITLPIEDEGGDI